MMTSYRCYLGFLLICNSLNNQAQIEGLVYSNAVWKRHKITKKIQKQDLQPTKYSNDEGKYLITVFDQLMCAKLFAGSNISGKILSIELQLSCITERTHLKCC
jgi:glucose dehydrogenase